MSENGKSWWFQVGLISFVGLSVILESDLVLAQPSNIVEDSTLGAESSVVETNFQGFPVEMITGGAKRGANLFHSFREFNVSEGRGAYFFSPSADIQNILTRVTGINRSEILGTLGTFGNSTPNLFLINPNGIIFGQNASLDVGGSFVATTADAIQFDNQGFFSASNPNTPPLLTVNPSALLFNQIATQPITHQGFFQVPDSKSLLLVGGNVELNGGILLAPGGRVELGGVAGQGTVGLNENSNNLSLSFPDGVERADVFLTNGAEVDVLAGNGGNIKIDARNINILGGSVLDAGIAPKLGTVNSQAGDIEINGTGKVNITDESFIFNQVQSQGKGGNINITTGSLSVSNGSRLLTRTAGKGNAGDVTITVRDTVSVDGVGSNGVPSSIFSGVRSGAEGNSGDINITARSLSVLNGSLLSTSTLGQGDAGDITINAQDRVSFDGDNQINFSSALSTVEKNAVGNGGNINITTGLLSVTNGAALVSNTFGKGNAGNVTITARDSVFFDGEGVNGDSSGVGSQVAPTAVGNGGDINITTRSLSVTNGAQLSSATAGQGNAGNITILASDTVSVDGVGKSGFSNLVNSIVFRDAKGRGGNINLMARALFITNGALLSSATLGQGDAGSITIQARDTVSFNGISSNGRSSGLASVTSARAIGRGGDITVNTSAFRMADGAFVNASTYNSNTGGNVTINSNTFEATNGGQVITSTRNSGRAGNISLNVTDKVILFGSDLTYADRLAQFGSNIVLNEGSASGLFANASERATGQGGDLKIETGQLIVQDGAEITVKATGEGSAGNVTVNAGIIQLDRGNITASTANGTGGNVFLNAKDLILMRNNSLISAEASRNANGGNVGIDTQFLVAFPNQNNDIVAFAERGNGGKITINNQRIFGLQERKATPPNNTNDIDASSEFGNNGTITIVAPEVDPTAGVLELPSTPVDAESLIAKDVCRLEDGKIARGSSFVITGKGGLPPSAEDPLINSHRIIGWETTSEEPESSAVILRERPQTDERAEEIYPVIQQAQGWKKSSDGILLLTAQATTATVQSLEGTSPQCRSR